MSYARLLRAHQHFSISASSPVAPSPVPLDFAFELTRDEIQGISQTVISLQKLEFPKQVRAFTGHGAIMAANVLNSPRAAPMSVFVANR